MPHRRSKDSPLRDRLRSRSAPWNDEALVAAVGWVAAAVAVVLFVVFDRVASVGFQAMVAPGTVAAGMAAYAWGADAPTERTRAQTP
jgi:hypothetical protein